jgi:hypothetical protein
LAVELRIDAETNSVGDTSQRSDRRVALIGNPLANGSTCHGMPAASFATRRHPDPGFQSCTAMVTVPRGLLNRTRKGLSCSEIPCWTLRWLAQAVAEAALMTAWGSALVLPMAPQLIAPSRSSSARSAAGSGQAALVHVEPPRPQQAICSATLPSQRNPRAETCTAWHPTA